MVFDAPRVRGLYVSLSDGWIYLNAPQAQIPEKVYAGLSNAFRTSRTMMRPEPTSGHHSRSYSAGRTGAQSTEETACRAIADLLGTRADCVVLGPNRQDLLIALARSISTRLHRSDVVLSPDPLFEPFAREANNAIYAQYDLTLGSIPAAQFSELVTGATRLVALPAADGLLGVVHDITSIAEITHDRARAWVLADLTDVVPYRLSSMDELGIDIAVVDVAGMGGPEVAALVFRSATMLGRLQRPLEFPTVSPGLLGGVSPVVDHYAGLNENASGTRRRRLEIAFEDMSAHMSKVYHHLLESLTLQSVHIVGVSGDATELGALDLDRIPRISVVLPDVPAATVHERLASNGIATVLPLSSPLLEEMGVADAGGAITIGLAPYNSEYDIDQLARVLASLA
ncbi:Aminotransferase class-V [Corynebacterium ciconiae DSM 44920]|uniref:aminotransferase class V-fold PLP-dependent enzyme n=1 Tax=Corynebacterium ciconiae TaxID=227319 RepID=UPI000365AAAE|nr:aminotransferase class V-fold PLP-dependent enzyme [Corynebacterium ciconiae]WKD60161.1 Aminotransferase class-V [Corynebacterium ciconiae DSM 44920]